MDYSVFISYRRQGGAHYARILKAELERRGYRVFLDYDELNDGRFDSRIMQAIESAPVFIFILSPGSLDRCVNEDDWVRHEIIYAMQTERNIVPVNFDGLFKAFPASLPEDVRSIIGQHQFSKIDSESLLQESVDKLVRNRIAPIVSPYNTGNTDTANGAEIFVLTDAECSINRFHKLLTVARPDEETSIRLNKGNHLLEFISTENPDIREQVRYTVTDNDYSDFIEIHLRERLLEAQPLFPVYKNGLFGYIDVHGTLRIPYQFRNADYFSEGMARVQNEEGLWGFIDKKGNIVATHSFIDAFSFNDGLARIQSKDGLWGFINRNGKLAIPCSFKNADSFREGMASVQDEEGLYGFIDKNGRPVIPCSFSLCGYFNDGLAVVRNKDNLYGFIDRNGKMAVPCSFRKVYVFGEGLAIVKNKNRLSFDDKYRQIGQLTFLNVNLFKDGLAEVESEAGLAYINKKGEIVWSENDPA